MDDHISDGGFTTNPPDASLRIRHRTHGWGWLRVYNTVMIFTLVYVLSTGPMYWIIHSSYFNVGRNRFIAALYYPIAWLCQFEPIGRWFDGYIGLWVY